MKFISFLPIFRNYLIYFFWQNSSACATLEPSVCAAKFTFIFFVAVTLCALIRVCCLLEGLHFAAAREVTLCMTVLLLFLVCLTLFEQPQCFISVSTYDICQAKPKRSNCYLQGVQNMHAAAPSSAVIVWLLEAPSHVREVTCTSISNSSVRHCPTSFDLSFHYFIRLHIIHINHTGLHITLLPDVTIRFSRSACSLSMLHASLVYPGTPLLLLYQDQTDAAEVA